MSTQPITWSLQETSQKLEPQLKQVAAMLEQGHWDAYEANIYGTGPEQTLLSEGDQHTLQETVKLWRHMSLPEFLTKCAHLANCNTIKEFLAKSGAITTSGLLGANYLIPVKIYDTLFVYATERDIVPDISAAMLGPAEIPGTTLNVDIAVDDTLYVTKGSSGGAKPEKAINTTQATLDFSNMWNVHFNITRDLIEDSKFSLIDLHVRMAGQEMGEYASEQAIVILNAAGDGDGSQNTEAAASDYVDWTDLSNAYSANLVDGFVSDTLLCSRHTWMDKIMQDVTFTAYDSTFHSAASSALNYAAPAPTGAPKIFGMNTVFFDIGGKTSTMNPDGDLTEMKSYVFAKPYALLSGRKRWLRIDNYSDPLNDLEGAVVTARQDSITLYKDAQCVITEA